MNTRLREKVTKKMRQTKDGSGVVLLGRMQIARHKVDGTNVLFAITHPGDFIQRNQMRSGFYEPEELEIIRSAFPKGGTFVDIGANVGNHSLFVGLFLDPKEIIPIEPNPLAYKVFVNNMILNGLDEKVDMSFLGMGLSDEPSDTFGMVFMQRNIGAGRMEEGTGEISTILGDDMIGDRKVDMIKMDVEGMEMRVLRSLEKTVARDKPRIFVEVDNDNREDFDAWAKDRGYRQAARFKRHKPNENILLVHESDALDG
jgi:FkbM family methyltransferase